MKREDVVKAVFMVKRNVTPEEEDALMEAHDAALKAPEGYALVTPTKTVTWARFATQDEAWLWAEWNYGRTSLQLVAEGWVLEWHTGKRT